MSPRRRPAEKLAAYRDGDVRNAGARRQLKLFEKATPGEFVQVNVKFVNVGGVRAYQYTALDGCTRLRVLPLYRRFQVLSSLDFFARGRSRVSVSNPADPNR